MQAVHALLKMAKLRPEDPDIPKHLARLHHALGESHQAIKVLQGSAARRTLATQRSLQCRLQQLTACGRCCAACLESVAIA